MFADVWVWSGAFQVGRWQRKLVSPGPVCERSTMALHSNGCPSLHHNASFAMLRVTTSDSYQLKNNKSIVDAWVWRDVFRVGILQMKYVSPGPCMKKVYNDSGHQQSAAMVVHQYITIHHPPCWVGILWPAITSKTAKRLWMFWCGVMSSRLEDGRWSCQTQPTHVYQAYISPQW